MLVLARDLSERFGGKRRISVYSALLLDKYDGYESGKTQREKEELLALKKEMNSKLRELKLRKARRTPKNIIYHRCMADFDNTLTFLPDGKMTKCEHYFNSGIIGDVDSYPLIDVEASDVFKEQYEIEDICYNCICYPNCIRLKKCHYDEKCSESCRKHSEENLLEAIVNEYEIWKSRKDKNARR